MVNRSKSPIWFTQSNNIEQTVSEISKSEFPETSILAITYEAISRDPQERYHLDCVCGSSGRGIDLVSCLLKKDKTSSYIWVDVTICRNAVWKWLVGLSECCSWQMLIEDARCSAWYREVSVMQCKAVLLSTDSCCKTSTSDGYNILWLVLQTNPFRAEEAILCSTHCTWLLVYCQCKIRLPTQVYMLVYENLGYISR